MFMEVSRRKIDTREPRVEIGVAERAFSSKIAPFLDTSLAVSVLTDGENSRGLAMETSQAYWTRLPLNRRPNYSPDKLFAGRR